MRDEIIRAFCDFLAGIGITPTTQLKADAGLQRAHIDGDRAGALNLVYKIHTDGRPSAYYKNHKTGEEGCWKFTGERPVFDKTQRLAHEAKQRQRAVAQAEFQRHMVGQARLIFKESPAAPPTNPYLTRKKIKPHSARIASKTWKIDYTDPDNGEFKSYFLISGDLLIPAYDKDRRLKSIQAIRQKGDKFQKRNFKGAPLSGCFSWIGKPTDTILFAEGFSTAASLHEHTGHLVIITFGAGNLAAVAQTVRNYFPDATFIFCADRDAHGAGEKAANAAAEATGGRVVLPPEGFNDFNDVVCAGEEIWL